MPSSWLPAYLFQKNEHAAKCPDPLMSKHRVLQVIDTRSAVKKIRLNSLSASTDLQALAQDVVDKCKLLSQSKIAKVSKCVRMKEESSAASLRRAHVHHSSAAVQISSATACIERLMSAICMFCMRPCASHHSFLNRKKNIVFLFVRVFVRVCFFFLPRCLSELVERQGGRDEQDFAEWDRQIVSDRRGGVRFSEPLSSLAPYITNLGWACASCNRTCNVGTWLWTLRAGSEGSFRAR
jgi:hypothetical protein